MAPGSVTASAAASNGTFDERGLREQLATAEDPTVPALELANLLAASERFREALAVVDTGLRRRVTPPLRQARASVLRDLGQRHLAVAELRAVERDLPPEEIDPVVRFELAQLEWLEGEAAAAAATLQRLQVLNANSAWLQDHRQEVAELMAAVQAGGRPRIVLIRDWLGNLRGADSVRARLSLLDWMLDATELEPDRARELHVLALGVALGDDSAAVRARAVQRGVPDPDFALEFFTEGLSDPSPLVRRCAAPRLAATLPERAAPQLFECMKSEDDALAFLAEHDALATLRAAPRSCSEADAGDASQRATLVAAWQRALEQP